MSWTLLDKAQKAADLVRAEFAEARITCRDAAEWFDIPKTTLNDFLNAKYTTWGNREATLDKLLAVEGWRPETRAALLVLRHHRQHTLREKFGPSADERGQAPMH